jgi:hypothetical protein
MTVGCTISFSMFGDIALHCYILQNLVFWFTCCLYQVCAVGRQYTSWHPFQNYVMMLNFESTIFVTMVRKLPNYWVGLWCGGSVHIMKTPFWMFKIASSSVTWSLLVKQRVSVTGALTLSTLLKWWSHNIYVQ